MHTANTRIPFIVILVMVALGFVRPASGQTSHNEAIPRGGRVGWARLRTPDQYWQRHSEADHRLSTFIRRETSLNMDPTWYSANAASLEDLCTYPFIFANSLAAVNSAQAQANLIEYLKRGGFIVVDACINHTINPDPDRFLAKNSAAFSALLPGCVVRQLPPEHEIYSCFFKMSEIPPHTYHDGQFDRRWARHGLYGVFMGDHMISIITLSGLQCGWAGVRATSSNHSEECMKMMVNIYVYAMIP